MAQTAYDIDMRMLSIPHSLPAAYELSAGTGWCGAGRTRKKSGVESGGHMEIWYDYNVLWVCLSTVLEIIIWPRIIRKHTGVTVSHWQPLLATTRVFSKGRLEK